MFVLQQSRIYQSFKITFIILKYENFLFYNELTCFSSQMAYVKSLLRNHRNVVYFIITILLNYSKGNCLNLMRYHDTFIKSTLLLYVLINNDSMHKEYMIIIRSHS